MVDQLFTEDQIRQGVSQITGSGAEMPPDAAGAGPGGEGGGASSTADETAYAVSVPNAAANCAIAAPGADLSIFLDTVYFGYAAAPTDGVLSISATGINTIEVPVTAAGAGFLPLNLKVPVNTGVTISLSAGGDGVVGRAAVIYKVA